MATKGATSIWMGKGIFKEGELASLAQKVPAVRPTQNQFESNQRHNARQCVMTTIDYMMRHPMAAKEIWYSIDSGAVVSDTSPGADGSSTDTPQETLKASTVGGIPNTYKASVYLALENGLTEEMLNKVDDARVPLAEIEVLLRGNNPFAPITRVNRADVAATDILDRRGFELERVEYRLEPIEDDHDHHHNHINASGIASVSLSSGEAMDGDRLEEWLEDLLGRFGTDILRTKGIVSVAGEDRKLALQAVNMMLEGDFVGAWGDDKRVSRLVFIGRNLNRDMLETGFLLCRKAAPEFAGKRRDI